jgi:predicted membrane protein
MDQDRWARRRERWDRRWERRWQRRQARLHSPGKHLAAGVIFLALGAVFLLGNMGYLDVREIFSFWPLILIVFGIVRIVESREDYGQTAGIFWVVIGLFFLLGSFGIIRLAFIQLWPVLLIGVGVLMLWRAALARRRPRPFQEWEKLEPQGVTGSATSDEANTSASSSNSVVSATAILGGVERRINSQDFRGGDVTAIMGGCNIDLRSASITPPHQPVLELFALFGGIEIRIPDDWTVVSELEVILGGFDDRKSEPPKNELKRLILRGTVLMGGVEVRN